MKPRFPVLLLPLLTLACGPAERATTPARTGAPARGRGFNVLLISIDSVRRDILGCYGHRPPHAPRTSPSPNLDRLAAAGVRLLEACSTTSWTLPSHITLLSGQPELVHAVDLDFHRCAPSRATLAATLRAAGYRTAGFFSGPYLEPHFGFARGFDSYRACYGPELQRASRECEGLRKLAAEAKSRLDFAAGARRRQELQRARQRLEVLSHRDVSSAAVSDAVLAELEECAADPRPWFLFAHYFDPHYDYVPPAPYDKLFDPDYGGSISGADFYTSKRISVPDRDHPGARLRRLSARDLEHIRALYDGELAWTDAQIGRVLGRLEELDLAARTLVIVVSDHGDEFFEHGGIGHRRTLFQEVVQIPLLVRLPGVVPAGRALPGLVSLADVFPTILELLDLPLPEHLAGRSFAGLWGAQPQARARDLLGRLVTTSAVRSARSGLWSRAVEVRESYRRGAIEILRERRWVEVPPGASARQSAEYRRQRERMAARETLLWFDLQRDPGELAGASDFGDRRAAAALAAFQRRYRELLFLRQNAAIAADDQRLTGALDALGYTRGAPPGSPPLSSESLTLPPPGLR